MSVWEEPISMKIVTNSKLSLTYHRNDEILIFIDSRQFCDDFGWYVSFFRFLLSCCWLLLIYHQVFFGFRLVLLIFIWTLLMHEYCWCICSIYVGCFKLFSMFPVFGWCLLVFCRLQLILFICFSIVVIFDWVLRWVTAWEKWVPLAGHFFLPRPFHVSFRIAFH